MTPNTEHKEVGRSSLSFVGIIITFIAIYAFLSPKGIINYSKTHRRPKIQTKEVIGKDIFYESNRLFLSYDMGIGKRELRKDWQVQIRGSVNYTDVKNLWLTLITPYDITGHDLFWQDKSYEKIKNVRNTKSSAHISYASLVRPADLCFVTATNDTIVLKTQDQKMIIVKNSMYYSDYVVIRSNYTITLNQMKDLAQLPIVKCFLSLETQGLDGIYETSIDQKTMQRIYDMTSLVNKQL